MGKVQRNLGFFCALWYTKNIKRVGDRSESMDVKKQMRYNNHILVRLLQRGITTDEVELVVNNGEIIENYHLLYNMIR